MKTTIFLFGLMIFAVGHSYAQNEPKENDDMYKFDFEVPELPFQNKDTFLLPSPSTNFQDNTISGDNMIIIKPNPREMAKMPVMPIDRSANFTILRKRLYNDHSRIQRPAPREKNNN